MWDLWQLKEAAGGGLLLRVKLEVRHNLDTAFHLLDITNLKEITSLDVCGCMNIDVTSLIDCIAQLTNLSIFVCRGCEHFTQYNLVSLVKQTPNLRYFDATYCAPVSYVHAYVILTCARKLEKLSVMPACETNRIHEWAKLMSTFNNVTFGAPIKTLMPNFGKFVMYAGRV